MWLGSGPVLFCNGMTGAPDPLTWGGGFLYCAGEVRQAGPRQGLRRRGRTESPAARLGVACPGSDRPEFSRRVLQLRPPTEDQMLSAPTRTHRRRSALMVLWISGLLLVSAVHPTRGQVDEDDPGEALRTVESLFGDYLHYARLGRFELADTQADLLLEHPDLDPVELVAIADRDKRSLTTLMLILRKSEAGENAGKVLDVLRQGELELRRDPERIRKNIEKLGGPPQMEHNATEHLVHSGEYAVPWMLHTLMDPGQAKLHSRVLTALPKIGQGAINPLVAALDMDDQVVRAQIARVLGKIGYAQAVPYLERILLDREANAAVSAAAGESVGMISSRYGRSGQGSAAEDFLLLGAQHYEEEGSVAADPREPNANVWYWNADTEFVEAVPVPQRVFGQVMAMRCCQESLRIEAANERAIALWLAANIRREARLGMDVESAEPAEADEPDATRPDGFPRSLYFTRAAGPRCAHLVLARAIAGGDAQVALGAIAALREVAGAVSLVGSEDHKQPLVQALEFPDRVVRVRAALALGNALPKTGFSGSALVVPVLADALTATGQDRYVVIDPDAENRNRVAGELRDAGGEVIAEDSFNKALDRARREFDGVSAFVLSTDSTAPGPAAALQALKGEFVFSRVPVVLLLKPGGEQTAEQLAAAYGTVDAIDAGAGQDELTEMLSGLRAASGQVLLDSELAASLALEAAATLHRVAADGRTVFNHGMAEPALIAALAGGNEELQTRCLSVLALIGTANAQQALAQAALADSNSESLRLAAFEALSASAKAHGNRLDDARVVSLLTLARDEADMIIRAAASQALGALNLTDNKASDIIRSYRRG